MMLQIKIIIIRLKRTFIRLRKALVIVGQDGPKVTRKGGGRVIYDVLMHVTCYSGLLLSSFISICIKLLLCKKKKNRSEFAVWFFEFKNSKRKQNRGISFNRTFIQRYILKKFVALRIVSQTFFKGREYGRVRHNSKYLRLNLCIFLKRLT